MTKTLVAMVAIVLFIGTACERVEPGYVGIKVNMHGTDKGVDSLPLVTGRVYYNPWTTNVYKFPTFVQQFTWTMDRNEGSRNDDSITFNSVEGVVINADIAVAYAFKADMVPHIFSTFRVPAEQITQGYVRNQIRDSFSRFASTMPIIEIYGARKQELLTDVITDLNSRLSPEGFTFDMISFVGALRVPEQVKISIDSVIQAQNRAKEADAKVAQVEAEARQRVAKATGHAEAILLEANAKAEANVVIARSVTPALIQFEALTKWDGVLPRFTGSAVPFVNLEGPTGR
jgi:regulator of protease activity HflC (stomatin/prohibitin superfamily)